MKNVILHIGAHKTATTYIQNTLHNNQETLANKGIAYIPLSEMRTGLTANLMNLDQKASETLSSILNATSFQDFERLIISDENIIGGFNDIVKYNEVAPYGAKRLARLKQVFKGYNLEVCFSIRKQDEYISSMYCEYLRSAGKYISFKEFIKGFDFLAFRWTDLITKFNNAVGNNALTVFSYDNFCENEKDIFEKLIGENADFLEEVTDKKMRSSFSNKTIEIIDHLAIKFHHNFVVRFADVIEDKIIEIERNERFDPWSESEKNILNENYLSDIEALKK